MRHPPYRDTPPIATRLVAGHMVFCRAQTLEEAVDTGLLAQAELLATQTDPAWRRPSWRQPIPHWHWVHYGLQ